MIWEAEARMADWEPWRFVTLGIAVVLIVIVILRRRKKKKREEDEF